MLLQGSAISPIVARLLPQLSRLAAMRLAAM